jgi:hypothetical protein
MLSYYLSWHMQTRLTPILFTDHDKTTAHTTRVRITTTLQPVLSSLYQL